jgi:protein ImuB
VWLRRLPTDRLTRAGLPAPADTAPFAPLAPLIIAGPVGSALRLTAVNDAAARLGLKTGMALADARAMHPAIAVADADPPADRRTLDAVADWCDRYTPLVGLDPPDGLVLDVSGCAHLFGGEAALCADITPRLANQGFRARVAVADTVGCAWAVARYGTASVVASQETREALTLLPVAALRIDPDLAATLAQTGLKRIADVIDRPRAPLAARFGEHFVRRIDQALGREDEPIAPRLPVPPYVAERRFAEPIALEADVLGTIENLAHELDRLLQRRGEGARRLQAVLFRADGKVHRITVGTGAPERQAARIRALFSERLTAIGDECDPGFGYDVVRLCALATERCDPLQTGLDAADHSAELAHLVDRLGARFGLRRITRPVPQNTHIPEFAVAAAPAHRIRRHPEEPRVAAHGQSYPQDTLALARPVRLFERPEPVEAIAEVPDGPPVRFRWRRVLHEVARAEGPERIAMEWWRDDRGRAFTRDYFRVESRDGARMWLYREGLFGSETDEPRWFLHGVFS